MACGQSIRFQQNLLRQPVTVLTMTTNDRQPSEPTSPWFGTLAL